MVNRGDIAENTKEPCSTCRTFPRFSHSSELNKIVASVVSLPGTSHCRVSSGTVWPGVIML